MNKGRFLNIDIEGEDNVGVISLKNFPNYISDIAKPKLKKALEEHFDAEVDVKSFNVFSVLPPIEVRCMISIELDGETRVQEITLNETWVY